MNQSCFLRRPGRLVNNYLKTKMDAGLSPVNGLLHPNCWSTDVVAYKYAKGDRIKRTICNEKNFGACSELSK